MTNRDDDWPDVITAEDYRRRIDAATRGDEVLHRLAGRPAPRAATHERTAAPQKATRPAVRRDPGPDPVAERRAFASNNPAWAPAPPPIDCAESAFQALILDMAYQWGWRSFHDPDPNPLYDADGERIYGDGRDRGFPDLFLVRPPRIVILELKTRRGTLKPEQRWWDADLSACPGIDYMVARPGPEHWPRIVALLLPEGNHETSHRHD